MPHRVGDVVEKVRADPRDDVVFQAVMAKRLIIVAGIYRHTGGLAYGSTCLILALSSGAMPGYSGPRPLHSYARIQKLRLRQTSEREHRNGGS